MLDDRACTEKREFLDTVAVPRQARPEMTNGRILRRTWGLPLRGARFPGVYHHAGVLTWRQEEGQRWWGSGLVVGRRDDDFPMGLKVW